MPLLVKRAVQPGDVVTLQDGTKGQLVEFDASGRVHLVVERGGRRIPFPHFARLDKVVSIEPPSPRADPRRERRIWTDITGKHEVPAKFVRVRDGKVELSKDDGIVKVPLNRLSTADVKLAQELAQEDQVGQIANGSFTDGRAAGAPQLAPAQIDAAGISTIVADRSQCQTVVLDETLPAKGLVPDPAPARPAALSDRPIAIPLPKAAGAGHVSEHPVEMAFAIANGQALLTFEVNDSGRERKRLVRCDLAGGRVLESLELPDDTLPLDVDAEGQVLAARAVASFGLDRVDYLALAAGEAKPIASWRPSERIEHVALIGKDHLLTVDEGHRVTVWKAAEAKALYTVAMDQGTVPAVSGAGKYLAIAGPAGDVYVLEALTGKPLARLAGDLIDAPQLSFHPDGKQLAGVRNGIVRVWDVTSGRLAYGIKVFPAHLAGRNFGLAWPAEGFLLADGEKLIDFKRGILLWHYHRFGIAATSQNVFGGRYWAAQRTQSGYALTSIPIPHAEALQAVAGLDGEGLLAVKPGLEVAVDVRIALPEVQQQAIRDSLVKRLKDNGLKVVEQANLVLHCATTTGPPQEVEYRRADRPYRPGEKVTVSNTTTSLWFSENGKTVWVASRTFSAPFQVQVANNDLRKAVTEQMGPAEDFVLTTPLPSRVPRPGNDPSGAYGSNRLPQLIGQ